MRALADTLETISPRCLRRWRLVGESGGVAAQLRGKGHEIIEEGEADVVFLLEGTAELPENTATLVFTLGNQEYPPDWRCWLSWPLDTDGRVTQDAPAHTLRLLLPPNYNLAEHMRALVLAGKAYDALELLQNTRDDLFRDDDERGRVATSEMLALFALDKALGIPGRLNRFAKALDAFNRAATWLPNAPMAYEVLGAFWDRIGRPDMRVRISNTICHAHGGDTLPVPEFVIPAKAGIQAKYSKAIHFDQCPRILMVIHPASDFGTDTLYDGLCDLLGDENVVEYPWKPTLHGKCVEKTMGYPCFFERGGEDIGIDAVTHQLREGQFDAVLFSDTLGSLPADTVAQLAHAGRSTPWYLLDMWDQPGNYREDIAARLPGIPFQAYFKREKITGCDYGPNAHALPFAYAQRYAATPSWENRTGLFWAGKPACGARRLMLEHLSRHFQLNLGASYSQDEYRRRLQTSLIGLCLFGNGFDTVRYWELPAHGVMLLAERPPIEIPHNFTDGQTAVFFNDLADLHQKLTHFLDHPHEALAIAQAGHAHYLNHHTATARAQYLLNHLKKP